MMVVLVCGSRSWRDEEVIEQRLRALPQQSTIMHGNARGADRIADRIARRIGFNVSVFPADWLRYGRAAGPLRNRQMLAENPDLVIAFWDGKSRGTQDMIDEATARGFEVEIVPSFPIEVLSE